jgi:hypothetical protein
VKAPSSSGRVAVNFLWTYLEEEGPSLYVASAQVAASQRSRLLMAVMTSLPLDAVGLEHKTQPVPSSDKMALDIDING